MNLCTIGPLEHASEIGIEPVRTGDDLVVCLDPELPRAKQFPGISWVLVLRLMLLVVGVRFRA